MLYVGIDWADDHHDVCLTDDSAQTLAQFQIPHTPEGFNTLHATLARHQTDPRPVAVALETSRGLLVHDLLRHGYQVYAVNPKAVNRYKDRHVLSRAKSDRVDALSMAHLLRTDRHCFKPLRPLPEDYRLLDRLCADLRKIIDDKVRVINQLTAVLKEYYPQPLGLFASFDSRIALVFLAAFADPQSLRGVKKSRFLAFFKRHGYTHPERVESMWQQAQSPALEADPVIVRAGRLRLSALVDQLQALRQHQAQYEHEIQAILDQLPESKILPTLPGVDKRLAPELAAALGPNRPDQPKRFESAQELSQLAGCVPITRASGQWKTVTVRRACVKSLRRTFYNWAQASLLTSKWARAYYDYRKAQQHRHSTILRSLGSKWSKILYALWANGDVYNEAHHIQQLKNHKVVWAMTLS